MKNSKTDTSFQLKKESFVFLNMLISILFLLIILEWLLDWNDTTMVIKCLLKKFSARDMKIRKQDIWDLMVKLNLKKRLNSLMRQNLSLD